MGFTNIWSDQAVPLLCGLLGLYIVRTIATWAKLRQFNGQPWSGISNWPHSLALLRGNCHEYYAEANKKYGKIARIAPKILITSSPEVWARVNSNPGYKRSDWYYQACRIEHRKDNVFTQTDTKKHDDRRKQMAPGYSPRENAGLEASIDERVVDFLKLIESKYISTNSRIIPMDLARKVQYFTLDVITSVAMSKPFGMLKADDDVDNYLQSSEAGFDAINKAAAFGISWLPQVPILGAFLSPSPKGNNGIGKMMAACFCMVDERAERAAKSVDERSDMLASFMRHGLSGAELRTEVLEQIIAGTDTTAGAIRGTLLHIITNPRVYTRLQSEIDDAVRDGKAPAPGTGIVSLAQSKQMPYLQAVIREGMRLWPPLASLFPRDVPAGGDTIVVDGESFYLPEGVCIGYCAYGMHRSEDIYGKDADVFRPERWFEKDEARLAYMSRTNDLIFGYGKFRCLGKPVAQFEIAKVLFEVLRHFDLALINPKSPWHTVNYLGFFSISDMWVQVMRRNTVAM